MLSVLLVTVSKILTKTWKFRSFALNEKLESNVILLNIGFMHVAEVYPLENLTHSLDFLVPFVSNSYSICNVIRQLEIPVDAAFSDKRTE